VNTKVFTSAEILDALTLRLRSLRLPFIGTGAVAAVCFVVAAAVFSWLGTTYIALLSGWIALVVGIVAVAAFSAIGGTLIARRSVVKALCATVAEDAAAQFVTAPGGKVVAVNDSMRKIMAEYGDGGEVLPQTTAELIDRLTRGMSDLELSRITKSAELGYRDRAEIKLIGVSGRAWFRFSVTPAGGIPGYAVWLIEDVTAAKAAEIRHRREERFVADLLDQLPVGLFSVTGEGEFGYANKTLREWLGLPSETGDGQVRFTDFVVADRDGEEDPDLQTDPSGLHGGIRLKNARGEEFNAYLIQSQRQNSDGEFLYSRSVVLRDPFLPVLDDGSGGALAKRIPWLFSEAPVGIVLVDLQGNVVDCNRSFLKMLGLHREAVVARPLSDRISKEDRDDTAAALSKVVMGAMRATVLEVRMPAGGERELAASLYVSRVQDREGDVSGLVLHVIDTTEQKNLEVQFNQSQKMQAVGQLAGGVAHDFNNLLTAMIGFCDLLLGRHGPEDPSFADIMQIKQNANRAANLVRQLLAFSRRQTLQPKIFDIKDALSDLSNLLRRLIGENIELVITHGPDVDLIRSDPGQFDQVIINLAVNARDAMPGGGAITIETERVSLSQSIQRGHEVMPAGQYVLMKVSDTGGGIPKEDIGHIFEPFFSTKGVGEGTGLGLSTVYGIVRQSDGFIFVDSAVGEGTIFSIYLPAYSAADAAAAGEAIVRVAHGTLEHETDEDLTGGGTVLLVEDEDAVRVFGSRALRNQGYRVLEAIDGEEALDVLNEFDDPVDLIITDVMMPGMDGHTLVRLIKQEMPEIKVILMSGYTEEAIPGDIDADSGIHFLPKPFSLQELAGKVKDVMAE